jgi:hypothetical protein
MFWPPAVHRCIAKIALVFIVFGTVAPTLSHSVMAGGALVRDNASRAAAFFLS